MKKFSTFNGFFSQNPATMPQMPNNMQSNPNTVASEVTAEQSFEDTINYDLQDLPQNENSSLEECDCTYSPQFDISENAKVLFKKMQIHDNIINNNTILKHNSE